MTWIQTYTGVAFDLLAPSPDMVVLEDVVHALAHLGRYTGHARFHYSVAEHSVHVLRRVRELGGDRSVQRQALMHDAHEAYVGDVASPIKVAMRKAWNSKTSDFDEIEERCRCAVAVAFGLPETLHSLVKIADLEMLMTEARDLLGPPPKPWGIPADPLPAAEYAPIGWPPALAKQRFLDAWRGLQ